MIFTLHGETPSKKNSRIFNTKTKHSFPNKRYSEWHKKVCNELNYLLLTKKIQKIDTGKRVELITTFYHGTFIRRDSDNQLSSILDVLVDVGIIADDNWKIIPIKHIYDVYDKGNPRVEVEINEI